MYFAPDIATAKLLIILVPLMCCLFGLISNDIFNVSIGIFLRRYMHQHQIHENNLHPRFEMQNWCVASSCDMYE